MSNKAIQYVLDHVIEPALACNGLDKSFKNKVQNSRNLFRKFKKSGDMFKYLQRFKDSHGTGNDDLYGAFKELGLKTFEDIYDEVSTKFRYEIDDVTVLEDFIIGEEYTSYDIAIFSKVYSVQQGIYLVGDESNYQAIFIKVTLQNGTYPNEWIIPGKELKYYMFAPSERYDPTYKQNKAIINSGDIPIYVFIKEGTVCKLEGIFEYVEYITEEDDRKWFRLKKKEFKKFDGLITAQQYNKELEGDIKNIQQLSDAEINDRISKSDTPEIITVVSKVYKRNPEVVVATLRRANGYCEKCGCEAPFIRKSDNTPYLEVHHVVPLSEGGDDNLENTIALCPNCHRELHLGI
ncbi:HNH endonuclease [Turicibacter sanguinis]|uniref:HNH endonuclease n=1 Tax=Turicibacter sanguinis TaxID=154288 RepID=UPI0032EAC7B1